MTIRTATPQDLPAVAEIHVRSWQTAFRGIMPDALLDAMDVADREEMWRRSLQRHPGGIVVALDDQEEIVGFCCFGRAPGDSHDVPFDSRIYALHVHPDRKRQGIGTRLVFAVFRRLRDFGCRSVILWTLESLASSRSFYEYLGGTLSRSKITNFDGTELVEVAYVWEDLSR